MPTQQQIDEANAYLASTNKQVEDGLVALNQIKLEQEGVQAGIERLKNVSAKAQEELDRTNGDLDGATAARAAVLTELNDLNLKIGAAEADLAAAKTQTEQAVADGIKAATQAQADQDKIVSDAQDKVDALMAKKADIEKQIGPLADQVSRLTGQIAALNAQILSLNTQITTATATLSDLNDKQGVAQQNLSDLQAKSDALTSEITAKTAQSASLDTDIATKNQSVADLGQKIADLSKELEKNKLTNADYLKARANVVELQLTNEQRTQLLKAKYGELGEPFN